MYLNGILIVEGESDETLIKAILEAHVFKTDGYNLRNEDISFLINASKYHKIIVLTDPDEAGNIIRNRISKSIKNTFNVFLDRDKCNKRGKHGVAESTKEHILERLKEFISLEAPKIGNITKNDLVILGINGNPKSKEIRDYISHKFSLGVCNGKNILERINLLNITIEELKEAMSNYGN